MEGDGLKCFADIGLLSSFHLKSLIEFLCVRVLLGHVRFWTWAHTSGYQMKAPREMKWDRFWKGFDTHFQVEKERR